MMMIAVGCIRIILKKGTNMGFDVYGLNPQGEPKPEVIDWDDKEMTKAYFAWQENTEGAYFRNNVWYWRPLWNFICSVCDDILTDKDIDLGMENSGHIISKTKSKRIAARLRKIDGDLEDHQIGHERFMNGIPNEDCDICDGTGKRRKAPNTGAGHVKRNGCDGKGTKRPFETNYPFIADNVRQFGRFCDKSGGFEIF